MSDGAEATGAERPEKTITVTDLQRLLASLQPDDGLELNAVGNLTIWRGDEWLGWIELRFGEVEWLHGM